MKRALARGLWMLSALPLCAQTDSPPPTPATLPFPPIRIELGGYGENFSSGIGWWRGFDATIWVRKSRRFVPSFTFDQRTSDTGTQRYYSFFSYANWTDNFYTTQSISGLPAAPNGPLLFPRFRADLKPWWKLPPRRRLIAGLGFTEFRYTGGQQGIIVNPGLLYYRGSFVFDWEAFINGNQPGNLWSGSGLFAIQQGREGKHWIGATVGAGKQVYRALSTIPLDVRYSSTSVDVFYRRWLTRNFGFVASGGYLDAYHAYRRGIVSFNLFFEF